MATSPHDVDLERVIVHAVFMSRRCADTIFAMLDPSDFHDGRWRVIFRLAQEAFLEHGVVDEATVLGRMDDPQMYESLRHALSAEPKPVSRNVEVYCRTLVKYSEARAIMFKAETVIRECEGFSGDIEPVRRAAEAVTGAVGHRSDALDAPDLGTALDKHVEALLHPSESARIKTGIADLDGKLSGGLAPGALNMVGARRGVGKTALGLHIVHEALNHGHRVVWVSQEMPADEVCGRLIHIRSKVPTTERMGKFTPEEERRIRTAREQLGVLPLTIHDRPISPERLWAMCRGWRAAGRLDLLGVDYLQIMQIDRRDNEAQALSDGVMLMKRIAMEFHIPVLCLAQCRREGESRRARVYMSDFKGSGAIEEHADAVVLMWPSDKFDQLDCELAKNRRGRTGGFKVHADFETMTFGSIMPNFDSPVAVKAATAG